MRDRKSDAVRVREFDADRNEARGVERGRISNADWGRLRDETDGTRRPYLCQKENHTPVKA